ncbi:hypothetical protein [uncultured Parabacteroides sp.]|uniref:hypothetical protein n=1 Tax=uncultured Parabacteroides sp. TaxID=512312 RepID=UPI0025F3E225|nr:hypothetical protein [uncultured Parabacteroides sp.]MCD7849949.1 hypothetical protein [Parabacteroides sp.]
MSLTFRYRNNAFRDKRTDGLRSPSKKHDICQSGTEPSVHSDNAQLPKNRIFEKRKGMGQE